MEKTQFIDRRNLDLKKSPFKTGKWRFYDTIKLLYVVNGEIAFRSLKKTVWAKGGEMLFLSPNTLFSIDSVPETSSLEILSIQPEIFKGFYGDGLSAQILDDILARPDVEYFKASAKSSIGRRLIQAEKDLFFVNKKSEYSLLNESIKLLQIIQILSEVVAGKKQRISKQSLAEKKLVLMLRYIDRNLAAQITTKDLGAAADIKERECLRIFQDLIKVSPGQYIMQRRLEMAESMLSGAQVISTADIAKKCGFVSSSYFIKLFKRTYGKTPGQYVLEATVSRNSDNPLDALSDFFG